MSHEDAEVALASWLASRRPDAEAVRLRAIDRVDVGHSAETLLVTATWTEHGTERDQGLVVRIRPPAPGLLPPYDLRRQFEILRALELTAVRAPRPLWYEGTGTVLGREFYVMERLQGQVFEREVPIDLARDEQRIGRMCDSMIGQLAAIHTVDLEATGLATIADGRDYVDRELAHWSSEIGRVQRGALPALEQLHRELVAQQPTPNPTVSLVHGDPKVGNFAFVGEEVTAVFDWEMATLGDALADLGWAEMLWRTPGSLTALPGAPTVDEMVAQWEALTGIRASHRGWYRAFQRFKTAVILLVGVQLFDDGYTDDLRFAQMADNIPYYTSRALAELGVHDGLDQGAYRPVRSA